MEVKILVGKPIVSVISEPRLDLAGLNSILEWVKDRKPECIPGSDVEDFLDLLPHEGVEYDHQGKRRALTSAELLVEVAGRKCYDSWGERAGRRTNRAYVEHTQSGAYPHASIMYHPKFTFFVAGVSRSLSHELIRHYVGADRTEEGEPSQESTRFTHHHGAFVAPPRIVGDPAKLEAFRAEVQRSFDAYNAFIRGEIAEFRAANGGQDPKGLDRKRIYEAAGRLLHPAAETSLIWTANPVSLTKMLGERSDVAADLEFRRLALEWKALCLSRWPNLFIKLEEK